MPGFGTVVRKKIPRHYRQVLSAAVMSLGTFAVGLGKGYSSPGLASLQEEAVHGGIQITDQKGSWIASLSFLGALFGCLVGGMMLRLGRKKALLLVAVPFSLCWLLTFFAVRVEMIYVTSLIAGFCSAVTLLVTQMYVSEIAHPEIRGLLSGILKMMAYLGTLSSFILGSFLNWRALALMCGLAPMFLFLGIIWIPESPSFLLFQGKEVEALEALTWLRAKSGEEVAVEMETLRANILSKEKGIFPKCSECSVKFPYSQLGITCGLMFLQKFSGATVFFHYAVPIIKQIQGEQVNPHLAAIVIVILQFLGSITSGLLVDTVGRLPLLLVSVLMVSGNLFWFGLYMWTMTSGTPEVAPVFHWIPLLCIALFTLFYAIGIGPISWLMVGELFPLEYRAFCGAVSTLIGYVCAFTAVKTYVDIQSQWGLHGAFWIYSGISVVGVFFVFVSVPETKGVQLDEMEEHCQGREKKLPLR